MVGPIQGNTILLALIKQRGYFNFWKIPLVLVLFSGDI